MPMLSPPVKLSSTKLRYLHQQVRAAVGRRIDWLRIYIVNEEEILLAGTCKSMELRSSVEETVRRSVPLARLRNSIQVAELSSAARFSPLAGVPPTGVS